MRKLIIDPLQKAWSTYKISVYYRSVLQHGGQFYIGFLQQLLAGACTSLCSRVCRKDLRSKKHTARRAATIAPVSRKSLKGLLPRRNYTRVHGGKYSKMAAVRFKPRLLQGVYRSSCYSRAARPISRLFSALY